MELLVTIGLSENLEQAVTLLCVGVIVFLVIRAFRR